VISSAEQGPEAWKRLALDLTLDDERLLVPADHDAEAGDLCVADELLRDAVGQLDRSDRLFP
jgi:hypothetical protein